MKGLVEQHGGSVSAASGGPGGGAEFTVLLPTDDRVGAEGPSAATQDRGGESRSRVLVIDDNVDEADSLRDALTLAGHEVEAAYSAVERLEKARSFRPSVVFCDIGLPSMNGYEVAGALRADPALATTKLVALSGYARPEDVARAHAAGFDRHMTKPASIAELARLLGS